MASASNRTNRVTWVGSREACHKASAPSSPGWRAVREATACRISGNTRNKTVAAPNSSTTGASSSSQSSRAPPGPALTISPYSRSRHSSTNPPTRANTSRYRRCHHGGRALRATVCWWVTILRRSAGPRGSNRAARQTRAPTPAASQALWSGLKDQLVCSRSASGPTQDNALTRPAPSQGPIRNATAPMINASIHWMRAICQLEVPRLRRMANSRSTWRMNRAATMVTK